jgi:hypothetical protein
MKRIGLATGLRDIKAHLIEANVLVYRFKVDALSFTKQNVVIQKSGE